LRCATLGHHETPTSEQLQPRTGSQATEPEGDSRDRQREKRIEEIVEVAVELFAKEGVAGFSMRRVASLSDVTLSTLQHYFGKGENLLKITINSITPAISTDSAPSNTT